MKILVLGYIPKEIGGTYTTGIANVVYEFCKCKCPGVELLCYSSNVSSSNAKKVQEFRTWGYTKNIFCYICYVVKHPLQTIRSWRYYKNVLDVSPVRYMFYQINLHRCIKTFKPDIIHSLTSGLYPTAKQIVGKSIPCVVTFHGFHYKKAVNSLQDNHFIEAIMPLCDEVAVLTQETKKDLLKYFPFKYKHLAVIPNGCDTSKFFFNKDERKKIRLNLGISDGIPTFITVGSINENKGQLRFVEYLHKSPIKHYKYLIIGKGEYEDRIKSYIAENGLENNIVLLGYISNVDTYKYYSAADYYAMTSQSEGQSLSELEAESTGLRIIVNETLKGTIAGDITEKEKYYVMNFMKPNYEGFLNWIRMISKERNSTNIYDWNSVFSKYVQLFDDILSENNVN